MKFDISGAWDSVKDGIKEITEVAHEKTSSFHENYVSKVLPDCGKYGDEAKFVAEMVPGVAEYNAIKDGDWTAFAIAAGIDIAAVAIGAFTAGAGYAAVKGGGTAAKAGVRIAAKEIAEAGVEVVVRETVEASVKTVVKKSVEAGAKKAVKEAVETGVEVAVKETVEVGAKTVVREVAEAGAEKIAKETIEAGTEKIVKETSEGVVEKAVKEIAESSTEKVVKETAESVTEKTVKETAKAGADTVARETTEVSTEKLVKEAVETGAEKTAKETATTGAETAAKEMTEDSAEKITKELADEGTKATDGVVHRYLECRNQGLEGTRHPITGVEFARKTVDDGAGEFVEGVFPKFDSAFDTKLPKELYQESNFKQFKKANSDLIEKIDSTPELKNKFTSEQIAQIRDGVTTGAAPDGYVWHHNEEAGILQLVDEAIHSKTGHTGGREIWGGGY